MNREQIVQALLKHQYTHIQADGVAEELTNIDVQLVPLLEKWIQAEVESDFKAEGFSLLELMSLYKMAYPAALLTIDWLIKDPIQASAAINRGIR